MRLPTRNALGATLVALATLALVIVMGATFASPIPASAAPLADLPTETPPPPTPEPSNTPVPTATTPPPPTATATTPPPPPTDEPPEERRRPSATPTGTPTPTATPPPTATPGPATDLMIEKLADKQEVAPGGTVVFTLRISTTQGSTGVADVVVKDYVPEPFEVIDLTSDRGDIIVQGREVTAFPANLAPGETVLIRITARVPQGAAAGTVLNTATVTTSTPGDPPGNNTSSVPVRIVPVFVPQSLPVTADSNEPSALMRFLPWILLGALLLAFGFFILIQRRGWPLIRVPVKGISDADMALEAPAASSMPVTLTAAPSVLSAPAVTGLAPQLGPELPPARAPEALPPAPGTYSDEGDGDAA